jgi:predicted RNA-binding protein YlxR (DUF448 family)
MGTENLGAECKAGPKASHVPVRQCVGCRGRFPKSTLVRFVRRPEGGWRLDPLARMPGRGAYLCSASCTEKLKKNKRYKGMADAGWPEIGT